MWRVLIADDHSIVRRGVRAILEDMSDIEVAAEADSGDAVLDLIRSKQPFDAAILDMRMPGPSGLDLIRLVKTERPALPILVLSMHPADQYAVRVLKAGASGYLTKESVPDHLVQALRRILAGYRYVTPEVAELLLTGVTSPDDAPPHRRLSDREFEVLRMMADGRSVNEIASHLALSVKTVSTYRARVLEKLGLSTTADLIRYAVHHGLAG
jgi:two-component system, NarL family, invasion response regulator UvrY